MPDDPIIGHTHGDLVYADHARKQLYGLADCPPVGQIRFGVGSPAFGIDTESSTKDDGTLVMELKGNFFKVYL